MAKGRKHDIYFSIAIGALLVLVGLSFWARYQGERLTADARQWIQTAQVALLATFAVLLLLSFRHPLRNMNRKLFDERQRLAREKRRSRAKGG